MDNYELKILDIINRYNSFMIINRNILGVGLGQKIINGNKTSIPSLTFFVDKKLPYSTLDVNNMIPKYFYGVVTDVVDISVSTKKPNIVINDFLNPAEYEDDFKKDIKSGDIISNKNYPTPGIVSYKVNSKNNPDKEFLLSTYMVVTGNSLGDVGDPIQRLSNIHTTAKKQNVAVISKFKNLSFYRSKQEETLGPIKYNELDIGVLVLNASVHSEVGTWGIKKLTGFSEVKTSEEVIISHRASGKMLGTVTTLKTSIKVIYPKGKWAYFRNVILVDMPEIKEYHFGSLGLVESGVDPVTKEKAFKVFGILAGSFSSPAGNNYAFFIPIQRVLDELKSWNMELIL